jgi:hypothetical protein
VTAERLAVLGALGLVAVVGVAAPALLSGGQEPELELVPKGRTMEAMVPRHERTSAGTGWSIEDDATQATKEAVERALAGVTGGRADFAAIFATSGSDMNAILRAARRLLGPDVGIYGGTSDSRAVMTDKGYVRGAEKGYFVQHPEMAGKRGLAVMAVASREIVFGVGSADFTAFSSVQEAAGAAVSEAIRSAGKDPADPPDFVMTTVTIGSEEEVLEGIESVTGTRVPVLGGTAGGPEIAVFGRERSYPMGVSVAAVYTDLPVGWTFERGFDVADPNSGVVTKVDGQAVVEIDGEPAIDVYNRWLGGEITRLHERREDPGVVRDLLTLHPLYRKYTSPDGQDYFLFSHPWPKDDKLVDRSVATSTKIRPGERVYLSRGTWETLINRIGNLPRHAKVNGGIPVDDRPVLAIGYICGGILGIIPDSERDKLAPLVNYASGGCPCICNFTWGEQGFFPGIGSRHGNLSTPFIVIGAGPDE